MKTHLLPYIEQQQVFNAINLMHNPGPVGINQPVGEPRRPDELRRPT